MIKELELLIDNSLPIDVQTVLQMLIEDIDDAGSWLSPYAFGLYNGERIPQLITIMLEGSESLILALQKAFQIECPSVFVAKKSVIMDFRKAIYTNPEVALIALDDFALTLKKSHHPKESELLTLIYNVLTILTDGFSLNAQPLYFNNISTNAVMVPYHCELCHRLTTKRFCNMHTHGSSHRRKMEIKFKTYYQKRMQKSLFLRRLPNNTAQMMRFTVWNDLSINRLDMMKTIPPVSNQPILSMDWVKELPDTISKVSDCLYEPIEALGKALNDQSDLWQSINAKHTPASYSEHEILISTLFRYQLYCDLKNFDLRETKRKLDPEKVLKLYDNGQGMKLVNIAKRFDVSPQAVSKLLKKYNYKSN